MTRLELRDSQKVALSRLTEPGRNFAALWAEPRSGKTAVSLKLIEHKVPRVAVVVGPKIAEGVWRTEAAKWLGIPYRFHPLTAGNDYPDLTGRGVFRVTHLLFVNYEQFGKQPWQRLRPFLKELAQLADRQGMMFLDESHQIKTPNSVTGKNIRPLAHDWNGYRLLITGTPVTNPNQVDAIYGQWTFVNPEIRERWPSAKDFREYFGEWTNVKGYPELIKPIRQAELNAYIQNDVVTMVGPGDPVPIRKFNYRVPAEVLAASRRMLKQGVIYYNGNKWVPDPDMDPTDRAVIGLNPLVRLLRMRTLVAGWAKDDEGESFTVPQAARARLLALGKVLRRCDGKVIVACTHMHEIKLVRRYLTLKGIGHTIITGAVQNKNNVIEAFQRDPDLRVLLVQPRTVAMAVDISVANDLIWYTSDFNYVTFKQASDRIKLSPKSPTVWFLCGSRTVDEDVWVTLQEDHQHLTKVVGRIRRKKFR
ncbi:DNA helicase [Microbacterium phage Neferthena]|uniref:DNA helicase n=1 Tax=Microbacterium phage Neferthena TaxID=2301539 RepID=A0A385D4H9_9CAUD|nr:DNA helicase [Microbacterium phage Neferthena]AXQ52904.1 DNA helicase [Microbacterium phage Neferthena]